MDKLKHFLVGFGICCIAAIGKELYDWVSGTGTPEVMDAVATGLGGLTAVLYGVFKK